MTMLDRVEIPRSRFAVRLAVTGSVVGSEGENDALIKDQRFA